MTTSVASFSFNVNSDNIDLLSHMHNNYYMRYFLFALALSFFFSCKTPKSAGDVKLLEKESTFNFITSDELSDVLSNAKRNNKLVLVDVYTNWCMPCKMMDSSVFMDQKLGEYVNEKFVSYKLNAERGNGPELANHYSVKGYPTIIFLDQKGEILTSEVGMVSTSEMWNMAEEAWSLGGLEQL